MQRFRRIAVRIHSKPIPEKAEKVFMLITMDIEEIIFSLNGY
jgi:hypothetical protein